jgi:hypothetical protein
LLLLKLSKLKLCMLATIPALINCKVYDVHALPGVGTCCVLRPLRQALLSCKHTTAVLQAFLQAALLCAPR